MSEQRHAGSRESSSGWGSEVEVMPGVFFTPAPGRRLQSSRAQDGGGGGGGEGAADTGALLAIVDATVGEAQAAMRLAASAGIASGCEVLHAEIERLSNSIFHLNRSNIEILEFDPSDPELLQAIDENKVVIRNQHLRIAVLYEMIQHIAAGHPAESFAIPDPAALARLAKAHHTAAASGGPAADGGGAPPPSTATSSSASASVVATSSAAETSPASQEHQGSDAGMWL